MATNFSKYERDPEFEKKYKEWKKLKPINIHRKKHTEEDIAKIKEWLNNEPTCVKKVK